MEYPFRLIFVSLEHVAVWRALLSLKVCANVAAGGDHFIIIMNLLLRMCLPGPGGVAEQNFGRRHAHRQPGRCRRWPIRCAAQLPRIAAAAGALGRHGLPNRWISERKIIVHSTIINHKLDLI